MKTFELTGTKREDIGTKYAKIIRKEGKVPCIVYGNGKQINFTVDQKAINGAVFTPNVYIVNLTIDGEVIKTFIKDLQFHPVTDEVMHADFYAFADDQEITVKLPYEFVGSSVGVKAGGKMKIAARKAKVKGLYNNLPETVKVDITDLDLEQSISVKDVKVENCQLVDPQDALICRVVPTRASKAVAKGDDDDKKKKKK
jgi:large subunit ribosomal protein L25